MATFFRANAYFQIKSNEDMTKPDSPDFQALEKLETDGYEEAKTLRREILQEVGFIQPPNRQPYTPKALLIHYRYSAKQTN
jgi:hypothetical protein